MFELTGDTHVEVIQDNTSSTLLSGLTQKITCPPLPPKSGYNFQMPYSVTFICSNNYRKYKHYGNIIVGFCVLERKGLWCKICDFTPDKERKNILWMRLFTKKIGLTAKIGIHFQHHLNCEVRWWQRHAMGCFAVSETIVVHKKWHCENIETTYLMTSAKRFKDGYWSTA